MNKAMWVSAAGCSGCGLNRRGFLRGCMACAASSTGLLASPAQSVAAAETTRPRIRLVFSQLPMLKPTWPCIGFDFEPRKREVIELLKQRCPNVDFLPVTIESAEDAKRVVADEKDIDGYLIYMLAIWNHGVMTIASSGKPTLLVDYLYGGSGEFLVSYAKARRMKLNVSGVSSSRDEDIVEAARCFEILKQPGGSPAAFVAACDAARKQTTKPMGDMACIPDPIEVANVSECLERLKQATMLFLGNDRPAVFDKIQKSFGMRTVSMPVEELLPLYDRADQDEARHVAERWIKEAEKVIEPTRETIEKAARIYLAMRALMKQHNADLIGVNCVYANWRTASASLRLLGFPPVKQ